VQRVVLLDGLGTQVANARLRVLYVVSRRNTFTNIDRAVLAERFEVIEYYQPRPLPNVMELVVKLRRCDVVFAWFASWQSFAALTAARLLGKPSVLVVGGFDTANVADIGYGWQQGGLRKRVSRRTMDLATRLVTNSHHSLAEIESNVGLDPRRVAVIYHGLADRFPDGGQRQRDRLALSVGVVRRENLGRKGHLPFVRAAAHLPTVEFVLAGRWLDHAIDLLRREAGTNVAFTGYLEDADLDTLFRRAAVYVQVSRHEGFGLSLAEAMLAGCVPVVTDAGALPEVVGDIGVTIPEPTPELVADAVLRALEMGREEGARARARVLDRFPLRARAEGLWREVEAAASGERSG
jgi:glycosyltransferase involved in cell wall biosynthesis